MFFRTGPQKTVHFWGGRAAAGVGPHGGGGQFPLASVNSPVLGANRGKPADDSLSSVKRPLLGANPGKPAEDFFSSVNSPLLGANPGKATHNSL